MDILILHLNSLLLIGDTLLCSIFKAGQVLLVYIDELLSIDEHKDGQAADVESS
jgi:hypothetical protein